MNVVPVDTTMGENISAIYFTFQSAVMPYLITYLVKGKSSDGSV
jgi:hypothetical protein